MKIRITDIPPEGRTLSFETDAAAINERANPAQKAPARETRLPEYIFVSAPVAELQLQLQGSSVSVMGRARARFRTACSRCAEELENDLGIDIALILKPRGTSSRPDDVEDLGFGYYDDKEIDCADIVEEHLILALPYAVTCAEPSVDTCAKAQANLKFLRQQEEAKQGSGDERFAVLRNLRLNDDTSLN